MPTPLTGPHHAPLSCGKPAWLVVLLHEEGADGDHIVELAVDWAPDLLKAEFIAPHAPLGSGQGQGQGRRWFDRLPNGQVEATALEASAAALRAAVEGWLTERKLGPERLALLGFGAGATLALHAGLGWPDVGAVVAIAGGWAGPVIAPPAGALADALPQLLLVDSAEPAPAGTPDVAATAALLTGAGWAVQQQTSPGDWHGLTEDGLQAIARFVKAALSTT